jgi:hypothetical protein
MAYCRCGFEEQGRDHDHEHPAASGHSRHSYKHSLASLEDGHPPQFPLPSHARLFVATFIPRFRLHLEWLQATVWPNSPGFFVPFIGLA